MTRRMSSREIASYAGACLKVVWEAHDRGLDLRNLQAVLCEDSRSVLFMLDDPKTGDCVTASFEIDEPLTEETFDHRKYCGGFWDEERGDG